MAVTAATIPITFYPINSSNNVFIFAEESGGDKTATIPPGYYSGQAFADAVEGQLNALSANTRTYIVAYASDTGKITITIPAGTLTMKFSSASSTAYAVMGFAASNAVSTTTITSTYPISIGGPKTVHIRINEVLHNVYNTYNSSLSNIVAVIPLVGSRFTTCVFQPYIPTPCEIASGATQLTITITDEFGTALDFNGINVDMELSIWEKRQ